jgi:hypothetical protein
MSVFPNPASEYLYLTFYFYESSALKCELLDVQGRLVRTLIDERMINGSYQQKVMLNDIQAGTYFVKSSVGQKHRMQKILVQ